MRTATFGLTAVCSFVVVIGGCTTYQTRVHNAPGRPTIYDDPQTPGLVQGIGIESQDLVSTTDLMVHDMLANPTLAGRDNPPRVVIDADYFKNEGSSRINKNMITDRLRLDLNRAATGRMVFLGRHHSDMVAKERELKRSGEVDAGTISHAEAPMGADYRLGGRITTHDSVDASSGLTSRYHLIVFEMIDLETSQIVWGEKYEFKKTSQDDVSYR